MTTTTNQTTTAGRVFVASMTSQEINARRAANEFINQPTHRVNLIDAAGVERMSAPAWGLDMAETIAAERVESFPGYRVEIVETIDTTGAPNFDDLNQAGQNIALYILNDKGIGVYYWPLVKTLSKRIAKGQAVNLETLAGCASLRRMIGAAVKECNRWGLNPTADDKRAAALYIARDIIETAKEEEAAK